ncbi:N-acetylornithine carbamoyltransferase [Galbibacter sp. EGI 63066]|uniref:N-acetylornithine carbamoyltransferase n=1 Tax=Galbibacter sp. EGI 63066 TaxID=2993559 RepID=UPI0022489394|nr:N-acetylornithine carbamoyltransferase [Galbibacter sp. EGI 63066]MCX2678721.1 N-acetylornithine carbamoyltransferase [Galbibacter sp. EGI 63066]
MKQYIDLEDINNVDQLIQQAIQLKSDPFAHKQLGKNKSIGMLFFNSSLRTRLSTQKAAQNLGMNIMVMNLNSEGWGLEFEDGSVMNAGTAEHIKEAAAVISQYVDVIALRAFPSLTDKVKDEEEQIIRSFQKYASVPVVNMESATAHPLQALTDAITIQEFKQKERPKVVLTWAPHPRALPHAVPNSFAKMMQMIDVDFCITHPEGYELNPKITGNTPIVYNQNEALKDADFVYAKNWSSYQDYGQIKSTDESWMLTLDKIKAAKFMHCLPVRRNMIVADEILDSDQSLVIQQANNRTYAAQAVLKEILED